MSSDEDAVESTPESDGDSGDTVAERLEDVDVERVLTLALSVALVVALVGVLYVALTPGEGADRYTEFYVLGTDGNASDYPTNLTVGETGRLIVGITNHEQAVTTYTVRLQFGDRKVGQQTVTLANGQTWEREFSFTPETSGRRPLNILLYKGSNPGPSANPYRELQLMVNTTANG